MSGPKRKRKARPAPLSVWLNAQEREILLARAGGVPPSTYLKQAALGAGPVPAGTRTRPRIDRAALARLLAELGQSRLTADLTALAEAARSGSLLVTAAVEVQFHEARGELGTMRTALLAALGVRTGERP